MEKLDGLEVAGKALAVSGARDELHIVLHAICEQEHTFSCIIHMFLGCSWEHRLEAANFESNGVIAFRAVRSLASTSSLGIC